MAENSSLPKPSNAQVHIYFQFQKRLQSDNMNTEIPPSQPEDYIYLKDFIFTLIS